MNLKFLLLLLLLKYIHFVSADRVQGCDVNCLSPRRPKTESEFILLGHHETSATVDEMNKKIALIKQRRKQTPWNKMNFEVANILKSQQNSSIGRPPNILMILADDLGFGDLSVFPFISKPFDSGPQNGIKGLKHDLDRDRTDINWHTWPCTGGGGILTPNLERMAANGVVMSNFHSASPVCSPSRVAVLTGLFPWRLGALNAFELGQQLSQRNGFLPQIPTGPEILRQHGYFTGHSGKWHLGGMREEQRVQRTMNDNCEKPSPNQHGFETYVSELDGPESPRYTFLLKNSQLHSRGYRYLLNDDVPMPISETPEVLSDREALDAVKMIKAITAADPDQPWYIQTWFNAPHGPWEVLPSGEQVYSQRYNVPQDFWKNFTCGNSRLHESREWQYKTMVSAMDASIGLLLDAIDSLGLAENTIIVFHSDNGPEVGAGQSGPYKERKRSLLEGGIRVPSIWQWKGHFKAGTATDVWAANVDLFPTFLDAARLPKPANVKWDGLSLLDALKLAHAQSNDTSAAFKSELQQHDSPHRPHHGNHSHALGDHNTHGYSLLSKRLFLWHKDTEPVSQSQPRVQSSAMFESVKIILEGDAGCLDRVFDLRHDPFEDNNLVAEKCKINKRTSKPLLREQLKASIGSSSFRQLCVKRRDIALKVDECITHQYNKLLDKIEYMLLHLINFIEEGSAPMRNYMKHAKEATCLVPRVDMVRAAEFGGSQPAY